MLAKQRSLRLLSQRRPRRSDGREEWSWLSSPRQRCHGSDSRWRDRLRSMAVLQRVRPLAPTLPQPWRMSLVHKIIPVVILTISLAGRARCETLTAATEPAAQLDDICCSANLRARRTGSASWCGGGVSPDRPIGGCRSLDDGLDSFRSHCRRSLLPRAGSAAVRALCQHRGPRTGNVLWIRQRRQRRTGLRKAIPIAAPGFVISGVSVRLLG
jgi:hypothetical protein